MSVYLSMTEVYPGATIQLEIVNGETDESVIKAESPPAPTDINPATIFDFQFDFQNIEFPDAGTYFVRFSSNDHSLLERPIEVVRVQKDDA